MSFRTRSRRAAIAWSSTAVPKLLLETYCAISVMD